MPPHGETHREERRRAWGRRALTILLAAWAIGALPLLALPVDWAAVCGCDACPVSGGPSCCCSSYPTWANADGTPGKRAALAQPSVGKKQNGCVGPVTQTAQDLRAHRLGARTGADLESPGENSGLPRSVQAAIRHPRILVVLPRPPPTGSMVR
ncbi:MAG: hypothetical protein AAGF23_00635 [Acidobacteriota bacterium]